MSSRNNSTLKELLYSNQSESITQDNTSDYIVLIDKVRDFLSKNYSEQLSISVTQDEKAIPVKNIIKGFIEQNDEFVKGYSIHELTEKLYSDMIGFSFLEKYIKDEDVEEILINSSDSIEIITSKGREKVSDKFSSPDVALNMLKKMTRLSGGYLDNKSPITSKNPHDLSRLWQYIDTS